MPYDLKPVEIAEHAILIGGSLILLAAVIRLTRLKRWGDVLRLPKGQDHDLQIFDLLFAFFAYLFIARMLNDLFTMAEGQPATAQPAPQPADDTPIASPQQVLAVAAGQLSTCIVLVLIGWRRFGRSLVAWGWQFHSIGRQLLQALIGYVALWPVCWGLLALALLVYGLFSESEPPQHIAILTLLDGATPTWLSVTTIISAVVLAPLVEEMLFRGLLLPLLERVFRSTWRAVLLSGLMFGLMHLSIVQSVPALIVFGIVLGYAYARTRSLTLVVLLHAIFNAKTILWLLLGADI